NGILLRLNIEADMFRGDTFNSFSKQGGIFNIICISQYGSSKSAWLTTCFLMIHIEGVFQLRMMLEHALIKISGQCDTTFTKYRNSCFYKVNLLRSHV